MTTSKRDEHRRNYKLKSERCQHGIDTLHDEYTLTLEAGNAWGRVVTAAASRLDDLKGDLFTACKDRRSPGTIQAALQKSVYAALRELADPQFVNRILKPGKRGRA